MVRDTETRRKFVKRTRKRRPVGVKLTRLGKIFKMKKYRAPGS